MIQSIFGMPVYVESLRPRYTLPDDVPPGTGMTREEFSAWSREVCGYQDPLVADGQILKTPYGLHMNERTWEKVKVAEAKTAKP